MSVYLFATLDTKAVEAQLLRDLISGLGLPVVVVDTGCLGEAGFSADVTREELFRYGGADLSEIADAGDRGIAVTRAAEGAEALIRAAHERGEVDGVIAIGGSAGTTIGSSAMRALPIGIPKVMVSTLASSDVRAWVGDKDIFMLNSVVDIAGLNRISRQVLRQAAGAIVGAIKAPPVEETGDRPLIAATMFGVTTPCVQQASRILEDAGYEVLVFHATGNGGQAMESLIREGLIVGVLDITTTELADELVGGILSAGPSRLTAAAEMGVPQVVSVGAMDMVNFGGETPDKFADRRFYVHNPTVTLMRTTSDECCRLGEEIASKVALSQGPSAIILPLEGVSAIDQAGQPFDDPAARQSLFDAIRRGCGDVELVELPCHINDPQFAQAAARRLLELIQDKARS
jgi:uncharacterized protein (UPF0261 family)